MKSLERLERLESRENEEHSEKVQFIRERYKGKSDFDFDFEKCSQVESWNPKLWFMNRGMGKIKSEFDLKGSWLVIRAGLAGRERDRERVCVKAEEKSEES